MLEVTMDTSALHKISCGLYVIGAKNGESFGGSVVDDGGIGGCLVWR